MWASLSVTDCALCDTSSLPCDRSALPGGASPVVSAPRQCPPHLSIRQGLTLTLMTPPGACPIPERLPLDMCFRCGALTMLTPQQLLRGNVFAAPSRASAALTRPHALLARCTPLRHAPHASHVPAGHRLYWSRPIRPVSRRTCCACSWCTTTPPRQIGWFPCRVASSPSTTARWAPPKQASSAAGGSDYTAEGRQHPAEGAAAKRAGDTITGQR